ncbi:MAG: sigma-70 family RNA polymerase sigma factor, partial [Bacteroidetes bacterium]|nr:sigma-70 family RNA polymerase sigma factor [Bacteroidota bacterium]
MDLATHTLDFELLRRDRNRFILQCQRTIAIIVRFHIQKGMFPASEFDDIVQSVNEELIRRLDGVARNFNGSVMLSTYMNVVIRNICLRIHERRLRAPVTEP